jgi:hypothetical protein
MIDVQQIARKASGLDEAGLQTLSEFLDFLLVRHRDTAEKPVFPESTFESPDMPSVYSGKALTLEEMREAIEWEAGHDR